MHLEKTIIERGKKMSVCQCFFWHTLICERNVRCFSAFRIYYEDSGTILSQKGIVIINGKKVVVK